MLITRKSDLSGNVTTIDLPVTQEQLDLYAEGNELLQNVFPHLDQSQREFIKTGITAEEWDAVFSDEDK